MQESATTNPNPSNTENINLMPVEASVNNATSAKHKKIGIIIAVILVIIIAIAGIVIAIILFRFNSSFTHDSPYKHSSYFIPESTEKNTKYALFDKEGKNLTGFTIKSYQSFVDGYALVRTLDGWSIIGEDGKPSVDVGKYDGITRVGGLYSAFKVGSGKHLLIHGSGRIVTEYDSERNSDLTDVSYGEKNALAVAIHREDDKYDIYNAHGEFVRQINSSKTPTINYYANGEVDKSATIISYEDGMIILKNQDLSEIANVSTAYKYEVRDISNDYKLVVLVRSKEEETTAPFDDDYYLPSSTSKYALINNGEYYNFEDQCKSISITNDSDDNPGYAYCTMSSGGGFIDATNEIHELITKNNERYFVIDSSHYALFNHRERTAIIDHDLIESVTSLDTSGSNYIITAGGKRSLYDKNGKKLCRLPDDVLRVAEFSSNGVAIARIDLTTTRTTESGKIVSTSYYNEYLINQECSPVSERYDYLSKIGDYYQAVNYSDKTTRSYSSRESALIDKDGKVRIDFGKYENFYPARNGISHSMIVADGGDRNRDLLNEKLDTIEENYHSLSYDSEQNIYAVTSDKFIKYIIPEGTVIHSVPRGDGARSHS